jgi:acyl transferase domain-containing protein/acyl carrier protein
MEMKLPSVAPSSEQMMTALREASLRLETVRLQQTEPLAVIGMACRFPGAPNLDAYWRLLREGIDAIGPVPAERWSDRDFPSATKQPGKVAFQGGGFLENIDQFDARFFEITQREARSLDPQQRLLLEIAWETLEHAGVTPESLKEDHCGVFVGICSNDYLLRLSQVAPTQIDPYFSTGNAHGTAAGRVSYFMQWDGPSIAVDTACSSSLVAVHLAMQSLRNQECDSALVLGVNVITSPHLSLSLSQAGVLSPTGRSRAFAAAADGFVRGEGCGGILLKRLSHALRDGDQVLGVLRGSAVNQDGHSNGLTAPNGHSQQSVIQSALRRAGLRPADIDYVEAHGTGTELGDPIEMGALQDVFGSALDQDKQSDSCLRVGSVKTNFGHLEGAAGIAGLIKTCLALHHGQVPPHLHFDAPSQHIQWHPRIVINQRLCAWPRNQTRPRRAGVSSFGFGGTNAHVIVEEAPDAKPIDHSRGSAGQRKTYWIKLSAKSPQALSAVAKSYGDFVSSHPTWDPDGFTCAANLGRTDFDHRAVIPFTTREQLLERLVVVASSGNQRNQRSENLKRENQRWIEEQISVDGDPPLAELSASYLRGELVDWSQFHSERRRTISLPGYPFQRQRCWFPFETSTVLEPKSPLAQSPLVQRDSMLQRRLDVATGLTVFETDLADFPSLAEHRVHGEATFPATGFLELAAQVGEQMATPAGSMGFSVCDLQLKHALTWSPWEPTVLQVHVPLDLKCEVYFKRNFNWEILASFQLRPLELTNDSLVHSPNIEHFSGNKVTRGEHYALCELAGLDYSGTFAGIEYICHQQTIAIGTVSQFDQHTDAAFRIHPGLLDSCLQSAIPLFGKNDPSHHPRQLWLPVAVERFHSIDLRHYKLDGNLTVIARLREPSTNRSERVLDFQVRAGDGQLLANIDGLFVRALANRAVLPGYRGKSAEGQAAGPSFYDSEEMTRYLRDLLADIMGCPPEEVLEDVPLENLGMDSMMAFELLQDLEKNMSMKLPMDRMFGGITLKDIVQQGQQMGMTRVQSAPEPVEFIEGAL